MTTLLASISRARPARVATAAACALIAAACTRDVRVAGVTGGPRIEGQRSRASGEDRGAWTWWYPSGAVRESGALADGRRVGTWRQWWSNGERRSEGARVPAPDGRASPREGPWTFWHPNGGIAGRGIYRAGKREGAWEYSLDDGRLDGDRSGLYHHDRKIADG